MISVEMEDVLAVLQLCKPYIIGIVAALVIGIVIMIACRRMSKEKRFLVRGEACDCDASCSCNLRKYDLFWTNGYVDWTCNRKWNY